MTHDDSYRRDAKIAPDQRLLEKLVCPMTKQKVFYDAERYAIISPEAGRSFPIRGGIPVMLPEESSEI